jgi:hypothetical protein
VPNFVARGHSFNLDLSLLYRKIAQDTRESQVRPLTHR